MKEEITADQYGTAEIPPKIPGVFGEGTVTILLTSFIELSTDNHPACGGGINPDKSLVASRSARSGKGCGGDRLCTPVVVSYPAI